MYKIVIVEDDRIIRKSIVNSDWSSIQAEVVGEATDGERGLEVIKTTNPHLIVTDINMPFMDGITFAKKVREINPSTRIIFLTGYDNFDYVHEAVLLKSDDYLLKPINHEVLIEKAQVALNAWFQENQKQEKLTASLPLLQQEFLSQVIFNSAEVDQTDIHNELLRLGIYLTGPEYLVINVRIQDYSENIDLYCYLKEWQMDTEIEILSFQYNEVFLILSIEAEQITWINRFTDDLLGALDKKIDQKVHLTTSSIYSEIQDIETGIVEVKGKMEYKKMKSSVDELNELEFSDSYDDYINQVKNYISIMQFQSLPLEEVKRFLFSIVVDLCVIYNRQTKKKSDRLNQFEIGQQVLQSRTIPEVIDVVETLIYKIEHSSNEQSLKEKSESLVYQALYYIEEHFTDRELSLVNVAKEIHVTPPYLSNLFKEKTSKNFTEYLLELRMEKAKELLESTRLRVQEIAEEVGYLNPHYFSSSFKKYTKMTPLEYRKSVVKNHN